MKKYPVPLFAALLCAAFAAPLPAQDEDPYAGETHTEAVAKAAGAEPAPKTPAASAPAKKTAAKKPARKKRPAPVSEYKFKTGDETPTYKFDKKADPILKPSKKKKGRAGASPSGAAAAGSGTPAGVPKLKKVKSFNEPDAPEGGAGGPDLGGIKLPPGVNIPGMGGK